jgi:LmbE family N-acetylglucosaminyl deacetylase
MGQIFRQEHKKIDALVEFAGRLAPFPPGIGLVLTFAGSDVVDSLARVFPNISFITASSKQDMPYPAVDPEDMLNISDTRYSVIAVYDWLEYCRWPRWALQKIEQLCCTNGVLIVALRKKGIFTRSFFSLRQLLRDMGFEMMTHAGQGLVNIKPNRGFFAEPKSLAGQVDRCFQGLILNLFTRYYLVAARKNKDRIQFLKDRLLAASPGASDFELLYPEWINKKNEWVKRNPEFRELNPIDISPESFAGKTILVLSPHPDDEIIGCGGTIVRFRHSGANVVILQMTDGTLTGALTEVRPPVASTVRLDESRQAAERLGVNELVVWGLQQRSFACSPATIEKMTELLDHLQPDMIFTPFVNDPHPDHKTANKILQASLKKAEYDVSSLKILSYQVWSLLPANRFCSIDREFDDKCEALMLYQTAMKALDYVEFCARLNTYESRLYRQSRGFVEAFLETNLQTYLSLNAGGDAELKPATS